MALRKRTKVIIGISAGVVVVAAAAVIAGPVIYANTVNGQAAAAPSLSASSSGTLDAKDADGTWTSKSSSYAGYRVHEVLQGNDVNVVGRTKDVKGTAVVDGGSLAKATVTVQVGKITTPEAARDEYFRSTALQTDKYPTATFELTKPVDVTKALDGSTQDVTLTGTMDLHGVEKPVTADAQVAVGKGGTVQVAGTVPITFADYGVKAPSLGFVTVDGKGSVEFSLDLGK
ncbi:YceI family protein [Curtobacterium aurantiacum]|uniref:YceI family protein n=1 Tax=Curtobacterium aurantiacum TaxID=3236919 RepID=A0ABS5VFV5_9MICO|nr:YceI family protein [Curtobacterium flaccumfaciens]MBT1545622.1 YceI family protein [Curtobacterium flaccumfaciens pv. flaccumfaciens]MBT1586892.1 YceI family protein [Curtobacterium flaccumfaciens pv. flaccumfaciens]